MFLRQQGAKNVFLLCILYFHNICAPSGWERK